MKLLAETTGDFMLLDLSTGQSVNAHRPSVITRSGFIDARIALSQIIKIADVPNEATDGDFASFWADSDQDRELAVASFLSKFDPDASQAPTPKNTRRSK